jgi:hypothetical protein
MYKSVVESLGLVEERRQQRVQAIEVSAEMQVNPSLFREISMR